MNRQTAETRWQARDKITGELIGSGYNSEDDAKTAVRWKKLKISNCRFVSYSFVMDHNSTADEVQIVYRDLKASLDGLERAYGRQINDAFKNMRLGTVADTMSWKLEDLTAWEWTLTVHIPEMREAVNMSFGDIEMLKGHLAELQKRYTTDVINATRWNSNSTNQTANVIDRAKIAAKATMISDNLASLGWEIRQIERAQQRIAALNAKFGCDTIG